MTSSIVNPGGRAIVSVPAGSKIAVASIGVVRVVQYIADPNIPAQQATLQRVSNTVYTSAAFTNAATLIIENDTNAANAYYEVGVAPVVKTHYPRERVQPVPNALDATGTLTHAMVCGGIVTSSTAAAVTATLDTGAVMEAASQWDIGESVMWSAINTGGANAFTVTASSGHTIVGAGAVAANTSGRFLTKKTAASTFVTYRV